MPILAKETDLYPPHLLDGDLSQFPEDSCWWAIYTLSRREKDFMRRLLALEVPFYGPVIPQRTKPPSGRVRTAYLPLFHNYVFLFGNNEARYQAMTTNCVSKYIQVVDGERLRRDLCQFRDLIAMDVPLTPESRLVPGQRVRVRRGRFRGFEGTIIRRENEVRLLVSVDFIQQGASLLLEDFEVEPL
jgi:transcriptional antiterminator RfaH